MSRITTFILGLLLAAGVPPGKSQDPEVGSYPPLVDIARFKRPSVAPDTGTCGVQAPSPFCAPVDAAEGLEKRSCNIRTCSQRCPGRDRDEDPHTSDPSRFIELLDGNKGRCIDYDHVGNKIGGIPSLRFYNDPECGLSPDRIVKMSRRGQFTATVWLKQMPRNAGVILEKAAGRPGQRKEIILTIMVGGFSLLIQYWGVNGRRNIQQLRAPFPPGQWHHLAIQVYGRDISIFIDGPGPDGTPFLVDKLTVAMQDVNIMPVTRIGQRFGAWNESSELATFLKREFPSVNSSSQYVGWMQDFRWYDKVLTNREIQEIATGTFPQINIVSRCLCPAGFPRVHPIEERFCIPNGVPDTDTFQRELRLDIDAHPLDYITDDDASTTWISSSDIYMPGGLTITIDLENGEYQVFYVVMHFYSPQPKMITISRMSNSTGGDMEVWGYFADDCDIRFSLENNVPLYTSTSIGCQQFPPTDEILYRNSTVRFTLLQKDPTPRPGHHDFYGTPELMDFVEATKVQVRFQYQYFTQAPEVHVQHQYYGLTGIQVVGKCNCHGHAKACDTEAKPYKCNCLESSFTEGNMCERCMPLYNNKPYHQGDNTSPYKCQKCNCHGHADSCHYQPDIDTHAGDYTQGGGGVCDNCKHHTTGLHCEECAELFFREPDKDLNSRDLCKPCACRKAGTVNATSLCEQIGGQCLCKPKVTSRRCNVCVDGFYKLQMENLDGCEECECFQAGTVNRSFTCDQRTGKCDCRGNVRGRKCSDCLFGFKNLTDSNPAGCEACNCNRTGSVNQFCNPNNGQCVCKNNVQGIFCDECQDGFWGLSLAGCRRCGCDVAGSESRTICDKVTGQCVCKAHTQGRTCNECVDEFYNLDGNNRMGCESCTCDDRGTVNGSLVCDKVQGQCSCKVNVKGRVCNLCRGNTFGLKFNLGSGCEPCNCDPKGTALGDQLSPHELVCDSNSGQCACLASREGRRCDQCSPGFYLPAKNESGCMVCDCHPVGSTSPVCNNETGVCPCKARGTGAGLTGRRCDQCDVTFWNFHSLFGSCESCGCDVAGSENAECNVITGQCSCKGNVVGKQCDSCRPGSSRLSATNPMGCYSHPEQQAAPSEKEVNPRWVVLEWNPPDHPNGDQLSYKLFRNDEVAQSINDTTPFTPTHTFNDTGLLPYTDYDYYIETSNIGGSVESPGLRVRTLAGVPTGVPPLTVSGVEAHKATFEWSEPSVAHGPIETYVLQSVTTENDDSVEVHYRGMDTRVTAQQLSAFTNYSFTVRACTSGGCGNSRPVVVITPEAKPRDQRPPVITPISNTSLEVSWEPPVEANGIIHQYEIMLRGKPGSDGVNRPLQRVVYRSHGAYNPRPVPPGEYSPLKPPGTNFTQDGLEPFTQYEVLVSSSNSLGSAQSPWTTARTLEGAPVFMNPPNLEPLSSFEMNITWESPDPVGEARGEVVMYQVILTRNNTRENPFAPPLQDVVIYSCGPGINQFTATGFKPYSTHSIKMNLCNHVACILSDVTNATTLPAAPSGQEPPAPAQRTMGSITLQWGNPLHVNGPRPDFTLLRSKVAFSRPPIEMSRGVRFPGNSLVRFPPSVLPRDASYTGIQLVFRTFEEDSLLLLAASPLSSGGVREELIVLQLKGGRPWFLFDPQDNPTSVTTQNDAGRKYNDGEWHRVEVNRFNRDAYIEMDGTFTGSSTSPRDTTVIGTNDGVFVGGIPSGYVIGRPDDVGSHVVVTQGHIGCIKDVRVQRDGSLADWSNVTWSEADQWERAYKPWQGCPVDLDRPGVHFLGRGYIKLSSTLGVLDPTVWTLTLRFRAAFASGILFFASGRNKDDFMMASLQKSTLRFIASTSPTHVTEVDFESNNVTINFCDGEWHTALFRNNYNELSIEVDGQPGIHKSRFQHSRNLTQFDLGRDLYVGGVTSKVMSDLLMILDEDSRSFGGCMKELSINRRHISLTRDVDLAVNVDLDGCPLGAKRNSHEATSSGEESGGGAVEFPPTATVTSQYFGATSNSCGESPIEVLYSGPDRGFVDRNFTDEAFTRILYKVSSSNAGGEAQSDWIVTRSGEGIPQTLPAPFDERSSSGYEIEAHWRRPVEANGVVVNYTLTATPEPHWVISTNGSSSGDGNHGNNASTEVTFKGDQHVGVIPGLDPYTNYSIQVTACTLQGCTKSAGSVRIQTQEEIPDGVRAPSADVNATDMTIRWMEPDAPNGRITKYELFHNDSKVYSGSSTHFAIHGLPIFTAQVFKLEACTSRGCNTSDPVTLYSGQLPPSHVDQPMVTVRGPHKVEVRWLEPAMLNGILDRYVLYLRNDSGSDLGFEVYNNSIPVLEHTLYDLIAGTQYYVTLAACTGGGCKLSSATPCQTKESVPEDIPPPDVATYTPYSFTVEWFRPGLPNGEITLYSLYQNDALIRNSSVPGSVELGGFTPWSRQTFRMRVCTKKGCSFGPAVAKRTRESPPVGQVSLSVAVLTPRSLDARWNNPERENGRMVYSVICDGLFYADSAAGDYSTVREARDMVTSSVTDEWTRVEGLIPHSEYIVKVNASNGAGYVISNMRSVKMPPGVPDGVTMPVLSPQSPYVILVTWKDPARNNAPGNSSFQLQYRGVSPPENEVNVFDDVTRQRSYELGGLLPYKEYEFRLIASNTIGSSESRWSSAFTKQAKPSSVDPPIVFQIDAWTLKVTWVKPSEPNGVIDAYRVFENEVLIVELPGNVTRFSAVTLTPFTSYIYRIEACTLVGCTSSANSRNVITHAAPPEGLAAPLIRSDTPSSVLVTWTRPLASNGILDNYKLERKLNDSDTSAIKFLGAFVPSQALRYLDEDVDLRPYTSYKYRVISSTLAGGNSASKWSAVRTRPGRPAGVLAPLVAVLGPETVKVDWSEPLQSNGPLERFEISFPEPRVVVSDVTITTRNVTNLIPYTEYEISIIACTSGGCTESPTTTAMTFTAVPRELEPPIATPITQRHVNVQWKPPKYPNGPGIFYELSRTILRQPLLQGTPPYMNVSENVYRGEDLMFEDRGLTKYTTCKYRLAVFNSQGSLSSEATSVTSLAGFPTHPATLQLAVHNHTSVYIWWLPPSLQQLQGEVHRYYLRYNSTLNDGDVIQIAPNVTSWRLGGLHPGTTYHFDVTVDNGAYNVTSDVITDTTDDGAPDGVGRPVVYPLSPTKLRVSWLPPNQPNGRIVDYNVIIDDVTMRTNLTEASSYVIDRLKPYTVYDIKIEACTVYACAVSNITQATTKETMATGIKPPEIRTLGSRSVSVSWEEPSLPNGIIRSYQLKRRALLSCSEIPEVEQPSCIYVKCSRGERVCGTKCYDPMKQICCSEKLHDVMSSKECCDGNYIAVRGSPSDVCCGGKFHEFKGNHRCCGGRYLKVTSNERCCVDPTEDRVAVGVGDACCGGVPYFNNGLQICCHGELHDAFESQCCGGEILSNEKQCCGGPLEGVKYDVTPNHKCCGLHYVITNTTICCKDEASNEAKVYPKIPESGSSTCCSVNRIASHQSCCNGVGFDPSTETCADVATTSLSDVTMPQNCGEGTLCPLGRSMFAACDRCDFDREYFDCFRTKPPVMTSRFLRDDDICPTSYIVIYSGPPTAFSFQDQEIEPHTRYQYKVVAENKAGLGESDPSDVTTPQAPPGDVIAPEWTSRDRDTITLTWLPPGKPNGVITEYALLRDDLEIWSGHALRHTDSYEILSYREYEYVIKVCTKAGCTRSSPVRATSIQGIPQLVPSPRLMVTGPYRILVTWLPPPRPNGFIQKYILNDTEVGTIFTLRPTTTSLGELRFEHEPLEAYSRHSYILTACTSHGCANSAEASARTSAAPPSGVWEHPLSLPLNSTTVELYWGEPEKPNGVIHEYRLLRRFAAQNGGSSEGLVRSSPWQLIHSGDAGIRSYTDSVSQKGESLVYELGAFNEAGFAMSRTHQVDLPLLVPARVSQATLQVLGPTSVKAEWTLSDDVTATADVTTSGDVNTTGVDDVRGFYYEIVLQRDRPHLILSGTTTVTTPSENKRMRREINARDEEEPTITAVSSDVLILIPVGRNMSHVITDLKPATTYHMRIRTCSNSTDVITSNVTEACNVGAPATVVTMTAPPSGQPEPKLTSSGPRTVLATWEPPLATNGPLTGFRLYRSLAAPSASQVPYEKLIFATNNVDDRSHTDSDPELRAYTRYRYQVVVTNNEGEAKSNWSDVTTLPDVPGGVEPPEVSPASAYAVTASWESPREANGLVTSYRLEYQKQSIDPTRMFPVVSALTVPSRITKATFSGLQPYTRYKVRVVAVNQVMMEGRSLWSHVTTLPAPPSEVGNLTSTKVKDGRSLLITWDEPTIPNGQISAYNLYEFGFDLPIYHGLKRQFLFRRLEPFTNYSLVLEACTGDDLCTRSRPTWLQTAETAPEAQSPPIVSFANASAVMVSWSKPKRANGRIASYHVMRKVMRRSSVQDHHNIRRRSLDISDIPFLWTGERGNPLLFEIDPWQSFTGGHRIRRRAIDHYDVTEDEGEIVYSVMDPVYDEYNYSDSDVMPFTKYGYKIRTRTNAGGVDSEWVTTETLQAPPEGLAPPTVAHPPDKNPTSLVVTWKPPERINGQLQTYRVQRNQSTPLSFPTSQTTFTDRDLKPYTLYSYTVSACTAGGCVISDVTTERTYEEAPLFVAQPYLAALNSTAFESVWGKPEIANGIITLYRLYVDGSVRYEGLDLSAEIGGLKPYSTYRVSLEACTTSGCRQSANAEVLTLEAPPSGLRAPELHVTSPNSIEVIWDAPDEPNGAIIRYEVRRNGELVTTNDGGATRYHDFNLKAGTEYTYHVFAFNNEGKVGSEPPVSETTDPSSPSGLPPPQLTPTSPSSIRAKWESPANPNGIIENYTLFVRHVTHRNQKSYNFSGPVFTFEVLGLRFFEEYIFWLQACTLQGCVMSARALQRTMEAPPANMRPPLVTLPYKDQVTLEITWSPPRDQHGVMTGYHLFRRRIVTTSHADEPLRAELIANLTHLAYADDRLLPFTRYQYKVVASNGAGEAPSPWSPPVTSGEAPPQGVPEPSFDDVTSRSVRVIAGEPEVTNGLVRLYHVLMKRNESTQALRKVSSAVRPDQTIVDLSPHTSYCFVIEACTLPTMCTRGRPAYVLTSPAPPSDQGGPFVVGVESTNISFAWSAPEQENGNITRYELVYRRSCPPPYQPSPRECAVGKPQTSYSGRRHHAIVTHLLPYTKYSFSVTSYNEYGSAESEWDSVTTAKQPPLYTSPLVANSNISVIVIGWHNSFRLNSVLMRYELTDRGEIIYAGVDSFFHLRRTSLQVHRFRVTAYTDTGSAQTQAFIWDSTKAGGKGDILIPSSEDYDQTNKDNDNNGDIMTSQLPFYQNMWFVVAMATLLILLVFAALVVALRRMRAPDRQRSPLKAPPSGRRFPPSSDVMMGSLPPYSGGDYALHSRPLTPGALRRSDSLESFHRSRSHLIGPQDISFDQSLFTDKHVVECNDQWERVYDDSLTFIGRPGAFEKRGLSAARGDSGMFEEGDEISATKETPIKFVDTHL